MQKLRKWSATLVATTALVTIVLLVTGWGSAFAGGVSSILVANDASHPVPVAISSTVPVHEQGTAAVNVTNSAPVPVSGTVTLSNTGNTVKVDSSSPIAVRDASQPTPVRYTFHYDLVGNDQDEVSPDPTRSSAPIVIPAGKALTIESVNIAGQVIPAQQLVVRLAGSDFIAETETGPTGTRSVTVGNYVTHLNLIAPTSSPVTVPVTIAKLGGSFTDGFFEDVAISGTMSTVP